MLFGCSCSANSVPRSPVSAVRCGAISLSKTSPSPSRKGVVMTKLTSVLLPRLLSLALFFLLTARVAAAQTPSPALLVLEKSDNTLAIVDPASLKIVGRVPAGPDPHEVEASSDGKLAYISNYGGSD